MTIKFNITKLITARIKDKLIEDYKSNSVTWNYCWLTSFTQPGSLIQLILVRPTIHDSTEMLYIKHQTWILSKTDSESKSHNNDAIVSKHIPRLHIHDVLHNTSTKRRMSQFGQARNWGIQKQHNSLLRLYNAIFPSRLHVTFVPRLIFRVLQTETMNRPLKQIN